MVGFITEVPPFPLQSHKGKTLGLKNVVITTLVVESSLVVRLENVARQASNVV